MANDGAIFHAKEGIIEDRPGQRLAFSGSVNEPPNGWSSSYGSFTTFCSWWPGGEDDIDALEASFLRLWQNQDPGTCIFTLPDAVRRHSEAQNRTRGSIQATSTSTTTVTATTRAATTTTTPCTTG